MLGGSYKEYPIYVLGIILFALIGQGYFDSDPIIIVLSVIGLIMLYLLVKPGYRRTIAPVKKA
jgi:positive regulator of sigma E activity